MKLGIIGGGVVGRATARAFQEHVDEVRVFDVLPARATHGMYMALQCDLVFVCLPEDKLDGFFKDINPGTTPFVLKSTVRVGTTRRLKDKYNLRIVHSPEFLTGRCNADAFLPARNIIGVPWARSSLEGRFTDRETRADACEYVLDELYHRRFPGVPVHFMSADESEAVKLITNGAFALKLAYFNEVREFCDAQDLDWDRVLAGVLADGRIAHSHTRIPGPDGKFGFGGCLEKDLDVLVDQITEAGVDAWVTGAAAERNVKDRRRAP